MCCYKQDEDKADEIKVSIVEKGLLKLIVEAIRKFSSSESLCYEGLGAIYHLAWNTQNNLVRSAVCGEQLKRAIKQSFLEKKQAGCQIENNATRTFYEVTREPNIQMAMKQDAVMCVVVNTYDRYRLGNEDIEYYGRMIQHYCVMWQKTKLDLFATCSMCEKKLDGSQGFGFRCARCQQRSYCSRDCQLAHWPKHKLHCQKSGNDKSNTKAAKVKTSNKKKSSKKANKKN